MWTHRYKANTAGTYRNPILIDIEPSASPTPNPNQDDLPPLPQRLGRPLPVELVSKMITILDKESQCATLATLGQANSQFYALAIPKIYETITIDETNMVELDYGYSNRTIALTHTTAPSSGVNGEPRAQDESSSEVPPAGSTSVRRHPAEEYCLRLVIDIPLDNISASLDRVFGPLFSPYSNIREIVYTSRALTDRGLISRPGGTMTGLWIPSYSPGIDNLADTVQPIRKTKRVILHLQPSLLCSIDGVLFDLSSWFQSRPTARQSTLFVLCGLNFAGPGYDLYCMDFECHFNQNGMPPGAFEHALAQWLFELFSKGKPESHPRLRLFDIPSLVFKDEDRPSDSAEANRAARSLIEALLTSKKRFGEQAEYLKAVMSKIDFYDSVYEDEEYPVVKPRPINELEAVVSG